MKIGIITFHCADNYGAILQTFGLYTKLKELYPSSEVFLVDYCPVSITKVYSLIKFKNMSSFITSLVSLPLSIKRKLKFNKFRNSNFNYIYLKNIHCLDYLICGSDQIWNPDITKGIDPCYFGQIEGFGGKIIAYAASDGGYFETIDNKIRGYVEKINAVSVRESAMLPIFSQSNKKIFVVLDPVFLINNNVWKNVSRKKKCKNYILVYLLERNEDLLKNVYSFAKQKGLKIIQITMRYPFWKIHKNKHKIVTTADISDFLSYILHAEYVFTNSFHGTASSIIFNKNFVAFKLKNKRNNRIHELLSTFDLLDRFRDNFNIEEQNDINYQIVNSLIETKRNESIFFLEKNIS